MASRDIVQTPANVFYDRLNKIRDKRHLDRGVEHLCRREFSQLEMTCLHFFYHG